MSTVRPHSPRSPGALAVLAACALALSAGCAAQSEMTNVWRDASLAPASLRNVLVVGIRKDPVRRRAWEDAFVAALSKRGVKATASYRQFESAPPDTGQVVGSIRAHGYDAVLTSVRLADDSETRYVPATYRNEPMSSRDYYGRFHSRWIVVQEPGYEETDTIIQVQTDVWSTAAGRGRLVWSGTLRTLETVNGGLVEKAVDDWIMPRLEKQNVFPKVAG